MQKLNNSLVVAIVLMFLGISTYAQNNLGNNNTTSPYSRFGLGELQHYSFGRSAAMGGASIGSRHSVQVNSSNPASYSSNDSLSFIFEMGMDATAVKYKSNSGTMTTDDVNFRYLSLSFPINKWMGAGMGLQPFSDMGYEVKYAEDVTNIGYIFHDYSGNGSISKAYFGGAITPIKGLSLGVNLNYIFGTLNSQSIIDFYQTDVFGNSKTESTRLRDFTISYGLQYDLKLKQNKYLTFGATFENKSNFTALHQLFAFTALDPTSAAYADTIEFVAEKKDIITMPLTFGLGLSYNEVNKLEVNADYYYAGWSRSTFFGKTDDYLTDRSRFSLGFEYIPEAFSIRSYMRRVRYRMGTHYENSYLVLNNKQIKEFGISFGAGFPLPKSKSTANFALEFGTEGTMEENLVKSRYVKFSLYFNLYDYWFMKRKID
jgi:hypothetical protein